jgi:hypothetical protein
MRLSAARAIAIFCGRIAWRRWSNGTSIANGLAAPPAGQHGSAVRADEHTLFIEQLQIAPDCLLGHRQFPRQRRDADGAFRADAVENQTPTLFC